MRWWGTTMGPELGVLLSKEWRQLLRNKTAVATALFLPMLVMMVVPAMQLFAARSGQAGRLPPGLNLPPALEKALLDPYAMLLALLPLMVSLGGLLGPAVTAIHTVLAERESRTLELLVALPVRMGQVLAAKLLVLVVLNCALCGVMLAVDGAVLLSLGLAGPGLVAALFLLLFCSTSFSSALALLVAVLARDQRSANNLNGVFVLPIILGSLAISVGGSLLLGSATLATLVLAGCFGVGGVLAAWVASRAGTFERLLR